MHKYTSPPRRRITAALVLANLCVLTLYVSGWSYGPPRIPGAQGGGRAVVREHPLNNEPVDIGDIKFRGGGRKFGERFEGGDAWLKDITLKVKNKSEKPVTYLRLDLTFPETRATGNVMLHQLYLGHRSDIPSLLNNQPLLLMPDESLDISLSSQFEEIKRMIEGRQPPVGNIGELVVRLGEVMFEDGTLYSGGALFKRNPDADSPRKWAILTEEQPAAPGN